MSYDHCIMFRFVSVSNFCLAILGFLGNLRIERFYIDSWSVEADLAYLILD